jgi:NADPH-ferrihemoprotein reductase
VLDGKSAIVSGESEEKKKVILSFQTKVVSGSAAKPVAIRTNQMKDSTKHFFTAVAGTVYCNKVSLARSLTHSLTHSLSYLSVKELRKGNSSEVGSTRHIEIDISGLNGSIQYETADNLAILPENNAEAVTQLGKVLKYNLDEVVTVEPVESNEDNSASWKYPFPVPCTVRDILTKYFDIHGAPRHGTVAQLLPYVSDMAQQNWLRDLVKSENRSKFKAYVEDGCRSLYDVISTELTSLQIPLSDLLHILTYLQPRYYTISSSSSLYPDTIHATVSVTEHKAPSGKVFKGLCSNYLASLKASSKVKIFVRPSTFRLPKSLSVPIVMIGPGTTHSLTHSLTYSHTYLFNSFTKVLASHP